MISDEIKIMIDNDLKKCKLFYKLITNEDASNEDMNITEDDMIELFIGMYSKYSSLISDFPHDIDFEDLQDKDDEIMEYRLMNYLGSVIKKLEMYKKMGYLNNDNSFNNNITINNNNEIKNNNKSKNENKNDLTNTNITYQDAKQQVENMSSLTDSEIDTIIQKIDELEAITKSSVRKSKKWDNVKEIIRWVLDKGFDVAKIIIPLALKLD